MTLRIVEGDPALIKNPYYPVLNSLLTSPASPQLHNKIKSPILTNFLKEIFPSKYRLYSDSTGKIKHIFIEHSESYINYSCRNPKGVQKNLFNIYQKLLESTDKDTKFTFLVCSKEDREALQKVFSDLKFENPGRVEIIITDKSVSNWTRDAAIPVKSDNQDKILFPKRLDPRVQQVTEDQDAFKSLQDRHISLVELQKHIVLEGGDVLSLGDTIFIGNTHVKATEYAILEKYKNNPDFGRFVRQYYEKLTGQKTTTATTEEMLNRLTPHFIATLFDSKVIVIGADNPETWDLEQQPVFHLDMFMSPAKDKDGNPVVIVGDPKLAKSIFDKLPQEEKDKNQLLQELLKLKDNALARRKSQNDFDEVAEYLKNNGFTVRRLPYLSGRGTRETHPYVTFTNCLTEDYIDKEGKHVKRVFLPQYGIEFLDKAARELYLELSYEIIPVDCLEISKRRGALRCITQVIKE